MIPHTLYDLALAWKKSGIWKKLWDSQLFAVKRRDGSLLFCSVMGANHQHLALAVYPGPKGLDSFRQFSGFRDVRDIFEEKEWAFSQDCIMLSFQNKDQLSQEEVLDISGYLQEKGIRLAGQKAFPLFERFRPHHHPWHLGEEDWEMLKEALLASAEVSKQLKAKHADSLGFTEGPPFDRSIPVLQLQGKAYAWDRLPLPAPQSIRHAAFRVEDDITKARLQKMKRSKERWVVHLLRHLDAIYDENDPEQLRLHPAPYYPMLMMVLNEKSGLLINLALSQHTDYALDFQHNLMDLLEQTGLPRQIFVRDERSHRFLSGLAETAGITLTRKNIIPQLEEALENLELQMEGSPEGDEPLDVDELQEMLQFFEDLPDLHQVPQEILLNLLNLKDSGHLSGSLEQRIRQELNRR